MKKTYFIGDMINNTGPAIVNKSYYPYLKSKMIFCFTNYKLFRTLHYLLYILFINNVIISGYSKLNILLLKIANTLNKRTFYLMHGFIKEELKYRDIFNKEKKIEEEYKLLETVDNIICVSEMFSNYLAQIYPEFKNKITYLNNGVNININKKRINSNKFNIVSVGGGMRQKNNLTICKAIEHGNLDVKFIVIGKLFEDGEKIRKYPFVEYYEFLPHDEVLNKMCEANLYIQNSYFETFGLAIMESLECGCDILISKSVGALSILDNINNNDIIDNVENIDEIIRKIKNKLMNNVCKISYNKEMCSCESQCKRLLEKVVNTNE